ncbi:MAG: hypothetical protein QOF51_2894 [Chloroflexota bacterium]|nr:hypothetical protein [Chloroflexota bacterium]
MFYLALRSAAVPREQWTTTLSEHLQWMKAQHEAGNILLSGPSSDRKYGMYLIKAGARAEADRIAASDPYTVAGHTTFEIIEWDIHQVFGIGEFGADRLIANRPPAAPGVAH